MYTPEDIVWIKNIKRNAGSDWAYQDKSFDEPFLLNWPKQFKGSVSKARIGDIIVLFQKPNYVDGHKNYNVFLTHLVTPIDEQEIEDLNNSKYPHCRRVKLLAIANPINAIPNPGNFNFYKPNRGQTHPLRNLGLSDNDSLHSKQLAIFNLFRNHFNPNLEFTFDLPISDIDEFGVLEGDKQIVHHLRYEKRLRDSRIVKLAKYNAIHKGNGFVQCECCGFDFRKTYGDLGLSFIECHHKNFITNGERITSIQDLGLVCSNCHRMLHRRNDSHDYYTIEELRNLIHSRH